MTLANRSIRTLAWLGDAELELEVRRRLCTRGDYPTDRLDAMKADVVCAPTQAGLLAAIEDALTEAESDVVRRGRNADIGAKSRSRTDVKTHRAATALEALVAHWTIMGQRDRFESVLLPHLDAAIDDAVSRLATKPRRG